MTVLKSRVGFLFAIVVGSGALTSVQEKPAPAKPPSAEERMAILRRAQVWAPVDVAAMNLKTGPQGQGAFAPGETVACDYVGRKLDGHSPKFACAIDSEDEVKVKFGEQNGEAFGEVAATRLLWALGFGSDRMYSVRVICRGCPAKLGGTPGSAPNESVFDIAAIERKAPGKTVESHSNEGWSWRELDLVEESAGGAPVAHRDALKLMAALMQHGDNKSAQQRLTCLDGEVGKQVSGRAGKDDGESREADERRLGVQELCVKPFMLISDLGLTFGRVDILNRNAPGSVNLERWAAAPIWKKDDRCVANLKRSLSGSLHDPVITEAGRKFLSGLLANLSDAQITDLFEVARFPRRVSGKPDAQGPRGTVDDWVAAFKAKRDEITSRHCEDMQ